MSVQKHMQVSDSFLNEHISQSYNHPGLKSVINVSYEQVFLVQKMSFLISSGDPEKEKCPLFESVNNYPICF